MPPMNLPGGRPNVTPPAGGPPGYADRIAKLKNRLDNPGANRQKIRGRISDVRSQQYLTQQKNRPDPTLPFNAERDSTVAGAARNRDISLQNNAYEAQQAQTNYGFDNPLANPYSKAALLQRSYDQFNRGAVNSSAAQGQLYSGSTQDTLDAGMFDFGQQWNQGQQEYQTSLRSIVDKNLGANTEYNDTVQGADAKALADALAQGIDPAAAPAQPGSVKKYVKGIRKDIRGLDKRGRDNRADKLRAKLKKLGVGNGR